MKLLIVDAAEKGMLGRSWRVGATLFQGFFDSVAFARSASDAFEALLDYDVGTLSHVQIWGHGLPGKPYIAGQALGPDNVAWKSVAGGTVWFRSCNVMNYEAGHAFAKRLTRHDISPVGHLSIVGTWAMHSHLVGLRPGDEPWWDKKYDGGTSSPWAPRTVPALTMSLPSWAFKKDPRFM